MLVSKYKQKIGGNWKQILTFYSMLIIHLFGENFRKTFLKGTSLKESVPNLSNDPLAWIFKLYLRIFLLMKESKSWMTSFNPAGQKNWHTFGKSFMTSSTETLSWRSLLSWLNKWSATWWQCYRTFFFVTDEAIAFVPTMFFQLCLIFVCEVVAYTTVKHVKGSYFQIIDEIGEAWQEKTLSVIRLQPPHQWGRKKVL